LDVLLHARPRPRRPLHAARRAALRPARPALPRADFQEALASARSLGGRGRLLRRRGTRARGLRRAPPEGRPRLLLPRRRRPARRAPMLLFYVEPGADIRRATLDGKPLLGESAQAAGDAGGGLRVSFASPPPEGLELLLETRAGAHTSLIVEDLSYGLPELPG